MRWTAWTVRWLLAAAAAWAMGCDDGGSEGVASDGATADAAGPEATTTDASTRDAAAGDAGIGDAAAGDAVVDAFMSPEGCNPIAAEWDCLLPWPSDVFRAPDPSTETGFRVAYTEQAVPRTSGGAAVDFTRDAPADGFPILPQIAALFPQGVDDADLVFFEPAPEDSLGPDSPTVLLEADSGRRVLHFAELDPAAPDDATRLLFVRPMEPLAPATRYVVAIRGLRDHAGEAVAPPAGFRRLRDGDDAGDEAARYATEVFAPLESAGVARAELQLAWDFTTRSDANATADLRAVRDAMRDAMAEAPPEVIVDMVTEPANGGGHRRIDGRLIVPAFTDDNVPGARLRRDVDGRPFARGTLEVPFLAFVPASVLARGPEDPPAGLLQFGHGFFGDRREIEGFPLQFADAQGYVVVGIDWAGMSRPDAGKVIVDLAGADPASALRFVERLHQGMANQMALARAAKEVLPTLSAFQVDGRPTYDPDYVWYYGISQGGILGGTYVAAALDLDAAVLSVGGAGFGLMMSRAAPFAPFLLIIEQQTAGALEAQKVTITTQHGLERIDPISYARHVAADPFDGPPAAHRVLMQLGLGDASVPTVAGHVHARALGLRHIVPAPRRVAGLETVEAPFEGSALVEFDFGVPEPLPGTYPTREPVESPTHEGVRRVPAGMRQVAAFLAVGGRVESVCEGPCDPE